MLARRREGEASESDGEGSTATVRGAGRAGCAKMVGCDVHAANSRGGFGPLMPERASDTCISCARPRRSEYAELGSE